jgi:hypothetical protein
MLKTAHWLWKGPSPYTLNRSKHVEHGEAVKHADMSRQLLDPERSCDVHMGGYDFQCSECHRIRNHKIAGRSTSVPVTEGGFSCEDCHGKQPHS